MMSLEVPTSQEQVRPKIDELYQQLEALRRDRNTLADFISIVQRVCTHPDTIPVSHTGHSFTRCTHCRKEW